MNGPITEKEIEGKFDSASQEEEEFKLFQFEEDARMEAEWLARQEAPFADRALDEVPDDEDFDNLALEVTPESDVYPLVGGGYAVVSPRDNSDKPLGYILSQQDPYGIYTPAGDRIGSTCHCEDYPCCGH